MDNTILNVMQRYAVEIGLYQDSWERELYNMRLADMIRSETEEGTYILKKLKDSLFCDEDKTYVISSCHITFLSADGFESSDYVLDIASDVKEIRVPFITYRHPRAVHIESFTQEHADIEELLRLSISENEELAEGTNNTIFFADFFN